jgi:ankyrin repeat protein
VSLPALLACFSALVGINARDADESTPLMIACYSDNVEAVRVLLHLGADVQLARADGDSALHVAVRRAAADSARLLLQARRVAARAQSARRDELGARRPLGQRGGARRAERDAAARTRST